MPEMNSKRLLINLKMAISTAIHMHVLTYSRMLQRFSGRLQTLSTSAAHVGHSHYVIIPSSVSVSPCVAGQSPQQQCLPEPRQWRLPACPPDTAPLLPTDLYATIRSVRCCQPVIHDFHARFMIEFCHAKNLVTCRHLAHQQVLQFTSAIDPGQAADNRSF